MTAGPSYESGSRVLSQPRVYGHVAINGRPRVFADPILNPRDGSRSSQPIFGTLRGSKRWIAVVEPREQADFGHDRFDVSSPCLPGTHRS